MKEALEKLIRKVLLPKYPFVKEFYIVADKKDEEQNSFKVQYLVDSSKYNENDWNKFQDITADTKNLYNVLGLDKYNKFEGVMFFNYQVDKMSESLKKLIGEIIPPKYPWIKNFEVFGEDDFGEHVYNIHYYVNYDEYKKKNRSEIARIKSDTKNLFDSLGPTENDFLKDISFENYAEWFKS